MSMIEKFLEQKNTLGKTIEEIRDAAIKAVEEKANEMIDNFVDNFKEMVTNASDEEFVSFLMSGKLEDEDIAAAIAFRAEARKDAKANDEPEEKCGHRVHVFVLK